MFKIFLIFSLFCGVQLVEFDHPCRQDIPSKGNFFPIFYEGIWYPIESTDWEGANCLVHRYTRRVNETLSFYHIEEGRKEGEPYSTEGIASIAFPEESSIRGIFNATIADPPIEFQYQVVASDYSNYAILWMCQELPDDRSREEVTISSRSLTLSSSNNAMVNFLLSEIGYDREQFRLVEHVQEICGFH